MSRRPAAGRSVLGTAPIAVLALGTLVVTGCGSSSPGTTTTSTTTIRASSSASAPALTAPGQARSAVNALLKASGSDHAVKVALTDTSATLTVVRDQKPVTWQWANGVVSQVDTDISDVQQLATFKPSDYRFDNLAGLFHQAAQVSGSTSRQQLQIVEYNQGQVLMTVTTDPETATVFFRPDATLVNTVDFATADGIAEALQDAVGSQDQVTQVAYDPRAGLSVQVPGEKQGTVDQTTRPANLPRWTSTLKGTSYAAFDPSLVKPEVIARILTGLRTSSASPSASRARTGASALPVQPTTGWTIDRRDTYAHQPLLRVMTTNGTRDFTLDGTDITSYIGGQ